MMGTPSPPAPTTAPRVAALMRITSMVRTPVMITGMAMGISSCNRRSRRVMPMPRPASTTAGGTPSIPATTFTITGRML
ncbi:MAG: hypothetical protein BWY79_01930 [Actinobacteria bacterium ADurb.Bin444]|nr:MAG: hypothetical protein BWY79_01930 [Actinobacteria bacterium ADurb.Bin444]